MIRLAVSRFKLMPQSPRTIFLFSLLIALLLGACSSSPTNSTSGSSSNATSSAPAAGNFEGTVVAKMAAGDQPIEVRYAIKGARTRVETQLSQGGNALGAVIMDMSSGSQIMLMPQTKTYMEMNWNDNGKFKDMVEKMAKEGGQNAAGSFKATSTGKTETIAGYACEHWIVGDKQDTDVCLAKGLGYFGGGGQSGGIFDKLKNLAMGDKEKAILDANPEFAKFVEGGAFPLKISQIENGQTKTIMEVTSVERKPLDDSLFAVPPDYKKMEIPGMPGMPMGKK
ncbi:MAG: DUF4412 domain-containing protein [Blastocatellales bacterium]